MGFHKPYKLRFDALTFLQNTFDFLERRGLQHNAYPIIASGCTFHNFTQDYRAAVLREVYKVLSHNGLFVNADVFAYDDPAQQEAELQKRIDLLRERFGKLGRPDLADAWAVHLKEDAQPERIQHEGAYIEQLRYIGFRDVKVVFRKRLEAVVRAVK